MNWSLLCRGSCLPSSSYMRKCISTFQPMCRISTSEIATSLLSCKELYMGKLFHDYVVRQSLDRDPFLANLLLRMYSNCLALQETRMLFFTQQHPRDRFAWNAVARVNARLGFLDDAMRYLFLMLQEDVAPDKVVLVSIISACTVTASLQAGETLHSYLTSDNFYEDVIVGTALISMYGKCGRINEASNVFENMKVCDAITWNAMISVYAQSEYSKEKAFEAFIQMGHEGIYPDHATFVSVLSSCCTESFLSQGKHLHAVVNLIGFDGDLMVHTAILNMYGKCSKPDETRKLFDQLRNHDVVSWNTMIGAYARNGKSNEALQLFQQMQKRGIRPDKVSYLSILEVFSSEDSISDAKHIHDCIRCNGFDSDIVVGTALINMYGRCGNPEDARIVFDKMPERNAFSWNSMISAYSQNGQGYNAVQMFKKMQQEGLKPDKFTLLSIVNACDNFLEIEEIQNCSSGTGLDSDDVTGSTLVSMYSKCGSINKSWAVFEALPKESLIVWNSMIAAFGRSEESSQGQQLFNQMLLQGFLPDKDSFIRILESYKNQSGLRGARKIHALLVGAKLDTSNQVGTALVSMYVRCGCLNNAWSVFDNINEQDKIVWTALISAYCQHEKYSEAFNLFIKMQLQGFQPDKVTLISILSACNNSAYVIEGQLIHAFIVEGGSDSNIIVSNALLNMYCRCGCLEEALLIFNKIPQRDAVTYASTLSVCATTATLSEGVRIHRCVTGTDIESDIIVGNALINFYGKCGCLEEVWYIFNKMKNWDTVTWTVMIAAYSLQGKGKAALEIFNRMCREGIKPNEITFVNVLLACSHDGLVNEACWLILYMRYVFDIMPVADHYDCLVDLFARAGRLEEAQFVIRVMPFPSTVISLTSFLNACKLNWDVERGEYAAKEVFTIEPGNPVPYVILSNIYSSTGIMNHF